MIRMEISNKTLAWLVVAAIVVSIFGTTVSLWNLDKEQNLAGNVYLTNDTGSASVTVSKAVVLKFSINATNFGTGQVNTSGGFQRCNMMINSTTPSTAVAYSGCLNFNPTASSLTLENLGTAFLNVTLNVSKNATNFLGNIGASLSPDVIGVTGSNVVDGSTAFLYTVSNNETGSCILGKLYNTSWVAVPNIPAPSVICENLSWNTANNSLMIGLNLTVTANSSGAKSVVFYVQGTDYP
jgi:hypothetical protein